MEQFLLDNADRYRKLVGAFKTPVAAKKTGGDNEVVNPDMVVAARIRPLLDEEDERGFPPAVFPRKNSNVIDIHDLRRPVRGLPTLNSFNFTVDRLFDQESTTAEIYESLVRPLVPWAWSGGVSTLFAYGQTGSGKTFTVSGLERHVAETLMGGALEGHRKLHVCVIELAGQTAYDLLNLRKQISILEDSFGTSQMAGAVEHNVTSLDAFAGLIEAAASLRRTAATQKNDTSSRSHAICRIRIENPAIPSAEDGMLYLVDLAGSEAARDRADHDATRMKESREINTSLSVLKDCIRGRAMVDAEVQTTGRSNKKTAYVPFRQSTLTKTLKHVFDPAGARSCKTVVVACVNPCLADFGASKNTLRYAEMLRVLVPKARTGEYDPRRPATWDNEKLRAWIDANSGKPPISSTLLAPLETGPQLLRLPVPEFLSRCLKTGESTSLEQAQAFYTKFWKLHVDSSSTLTLNPTPTKSKPPNTNTTTTTSTSATGNNNKRNSGTDELAAVINRQQILNTSADPDRDASAIPFKQRIRPGMVVQHTPPNYFFGMNNLPEGKNFALVLCPVSAVPEGTCDLAGNLVRVDDERKGGDGGGGKNDGKGGEGGGGGGGGGGKKWLAAVVLPAIMAGTYTVHMWKHLVVGEDEMDAEVLMEYDEATRVYYMIV